MVDQPPLHHCFSAEHEHFRASLRDFVAREITPFVSACDEAGTFPRALYRPMAELGTTGVGDAENLGGTPCDTFLKIVRSEEMARCGAAGVCASPGSHTIGLPPIAMAGSDVAAGRSRATRDAEHCGDNGEKTFMNNFNAERLVMSAQAYSFAQVCLDEALAWARQRQTFGQPLSQRQVIRHKRVDMALRIDAARSLVHRLAHRIGHRPADPQQRVARIAMAKVLATQAMQFCADQAVQILGGIGAMRGTKCARIYREVKVMMIGGGSEEIMQDMAARQWGI